MKTIRPRYKNPKAIKWHNVKSLIVDYQHKEKNQSESIKTVVKKLASKLKENHG